MNLVKNKNSEEDKKNIPRILVGCPTSFHKEYCLKEYAESIKNLTYKNFDVLLVDNSKDNGVYIEKIKELGLNAIKGLYFEGAMDRIVASRNILAQKTIKEDYDYFLSLEQDVIPPKDIIEQMLKSEKKIITGVYFNHNNIDGEIKLIPLVYKIVEDKLNKNTLPSMKPIEDSELWDNPKVMKIVSCGLGCILIHRDILKEIKFRHENTGAFDDRFFCIDLYNKKIHLYADTRIKCKHLTLNRPYPWREIKK